MNKKQKLTHTKKKKIIIQYSFLFDIQSTQTIDMISITVSNYFRMMRNIKFSDLTKFYLKI